MRSLLDRSLFVAVVALALGAAVMEARAKSPRESVMQEAFDVGTGGTLRVDVPDADLDLQTGASSQVEIEVFLGARDMERARELFRSMNFRARAGGDEVTLEADPIRRGWSWRDWGGYSIIVEVRLPEDFNLELRTDDGDIRVGDLQGTLDVVSSDGDIDLGSVEGPEVSVVTSDGDVHVDQLHSTTISIKTSDGDISIDQIDGRQVEMRTSDGDISIDSLSGALRASTGDGDIRLRIDRFDETTLQSGDGDISVKAPSSLAAELDLRGEDVVLRGWSGFSGSKSEGKASGSINGGGPRLKAATNDGTVSLAASQ